MNPLYSEQQIDQLRSEFPTLNVAEVLEGIAELSDSEPVRHPMALARSWLRRRATDPKPAGISPAARGSFRPDGSWDRSFHGPTRTEFVLREVGSAVLRLGLTPAEAVDLCAASDAKLAFRPDCMEIWKRLDGAIPNMRSTPYTREERIESAWAAAHTSTSAEEWFKRKIVTWYEWQRKQKLLAQPDTPIDA